MVWSPKVASRRSGCREAENEKPIDRGQPALSACQSREGGRTGMVVEHLKLFILGNNIVSNIKPRALTQIAEKGKVILLIKSLQKELSKCSYLQNNRVPVEGLTKNIIW